LNQIKGYDLGIDEFVAKPYSPRLVMKKIDAILSRHAGDDHNTRQFGVIELDLAAHRLLIAGEDVHLNKKEWDLLCLFLDHPAHVFTRDDLLNRVWGYDYFGDARTVDTHIKRLRQKLGPASNYVKTVYKTGYKFEE
jgi:two-component system response regulator VanR